MKKDEKKYSRKYILFLCESGPTRSTLRINNFEDRLKSEGQIKALPSSKIDFRLHLSSCLL